MKARQGLSVTCTMQDDVAVVRMDDGKMNAFGFKFIADFNAALDAAEANTAGAVVIFGNQKALSAGFDLSVMNKPPCDEVLALFNEGSNLMMRLFEYKRPVVMACAGHALALGASLSAVRPRPHALTLPSCCSTGAIMLLAGDIRLCAQNPKAKIGMNEVAIGKRNYRGASVLPQCSSVNTPLVGAHLLPFAWLHLHRTRITRL